MEGTAQEATAPDDGWEWAMVEVFGHRSHVGRVREEERFGVKMLRIDVPVITEPRAAPVEAADAMPAIEWSTHYYPGASIFSFTLTDEKSVMHAAVRRYSPPHRARLAAPEEHHDDGFDADDPQND